MAEPRHTTIEIAGWVERLQGGEGAARDHLLDVASERLLLLARKMFRGDFPRLARWAETDDLAQNARLRLWKALETARPESVLAFFRLAAVQVRRELIDLARHHFGPEGPAAHHTTRTGPFEDQLSSEDDPVRLAAWTEFHEQVQELPDDLCAVFDMLWYQGLTQIETAELLGVTERTIQRRWVAARQELSRRLREDPSA